MLNFIEYIYFVLLFLLLMEIYFILFLYYSILGLNKKKALR